MTEPSGKRSSKRREKGGKERERGGNKREKKGTKKRRKQKNLLTRYVGLSTSFLYKIGALKSVKQLYLVLRKTCITHYFVYRLTVIKHHTGNIGLALKQACLQTLSVPNDFCALQ